MGLATLLLLAPVLGAQTFVVDRAGGGQFTDLPQAIAAVPSGAVLRVRPGTYSGFTLQNKSLSILGDSAATVVVDLTTGNVVLGPLAVADKVVIQDLRCVASFLGGQVVAQNAAGQLILDGVTVTATLPPLLGDPVRVQITNCTNLHLLRCSLQPTQNSGGSSSGLAKCEVLNSVVEMAATLVEGEPGVASLSAFPGNPGLLVDGSTVFVHGGAVRGGTGAAASGCGLPSTGPTNGGTGCILRNGSTLQLVGGSIEGGTGGSGLSCRPAGANGGTGIAVQSGVFVNVSSAVAGGAGGWSTGQPGPATQVGAGGSIVTPGTPGVVASLQGTPGPGQTVQCRLSGRAGDLAILLFGYDQWIVPVPLITTGALQVVPVLSFGAFPVPGSGVLDVGIPIPVNWPLDQWIPFQYVVLPPTLTEVWATNSAGILVKT